MDVRHWMRRGVDELQACKQAPANFQRSVERNRLIMILWTFEKAMRWAFGCWKAWLFHAKNGNKRSLRPQLLPRRDVRLQKESVPQRVSGRVIFDTYLTIFERLFGEKLRNSNFPDPFFLGKLPNIRHRVYVTLFGSIRDVFGSWGGTNEANFSKTPSYSLSISRGSFSTGFSWSILSICVGTKSCWPSEAVVDEHKTLPGCSSCCSRGHCGNPWSTFQIRRFLLSPISEAIQTTESPKHARSWKSKVHFAPSIFSFSSSHRRKHLCNPKFPWTLKHL